MESTFHATTILGNAMQVLADRCGLGTRPDRRTGMDREIRGRIGPHLGRDGYHAAESVTIDVRLPHASSLRSDRRSVRPTLRPVSDS